MVSLYVCSFKSDAHSLNHLRCGKLEAWDSLMSKVSAAAAGGSSIAKSLPNYKPSKHFLPFIVSFVAPRKKKHIYSSSVWAETQVKVRVIEKSTMNMLVKASFSSPKKRLVFPGHQSSEKAPRTTVTRLKPDCNHNTPAAAQAPPPLWGTNWQAFQPITREHKVPSCTWLVE